MPVKEKWKTPTPSPWGWSPARQGQRPQGLRIRYNATSSKDSTIMPKAKDRQLCRSSCKGSFFRFCVFAYAMLKEHRPVVRQMD